MCDFTTILAKPMKHIVAVLEDCTQVLRFRYLSFAQEVLPLNGKIEIG